MKPTLLIVEDDPNIQLGLRELFTGEGFQVVACSRGDQAMACVRKEKPALVILDLMLPGLSGYDVCRQIRAEGLRVPVLMLTAKGQELDKVIGLDLGADDYVTKPFGVRELLARVQALLRRTLPNGNGGGNEPFSIGESTVDPKTFQVRRGKKTDDLTAKEMALLQFLHAHLGEVLSRDRLLNEVWGYSYGGTTRTLDQTVVQVRKKLDDPADAPRHLLTVHGVGYRLVV
jgi:DNA-binding response OmpR family regulator